MHSALRQATPSEPSPRLHVLAGLLEFHCHHRRRGGRICSPAAAKPVTLTIIIMQSITIFNDFTHPLYCLPGREDITVQLILYNFQSKFVTQINLLFMNILLVTIPPLVVFIFSIVRSWRA